MILALASRKWDDGQLLICFHNGKWQFCENVYTGVKNLAAGNWALNISVLISLIYTVVTLIPLTLSPYLTQSQMIHLVFQLCWYVWKNNTFIVLVG